MFDKIGNRLFKSWKSTLAGLLLIVIAVGLIWAGRTTLEALAAFATSLYLLFRKDKSIDERERQHIEASSRKSSDELARSLDAHSDERKPLSGQ